MGFKDRFKDLKPLTVEETIEVSDTYENPFLDSVKRKLSEKTALIPVWFEYSDKEKIALINTFLDTYLKENEISLSDDEKYHYADELFNSVYGFGELDFLLSDKEISLLIIKENEPVIAEKNGIKFESDVVIKEISILCEKIMTLSCLKSDKSVIKFGYGNLIITLIKPPVSSPMIVIKKKIRDTTDFEYFLQNHKIDENIYSFLISLINEKKNILISGKPNSGKTSYVEAFLSAIPNFTLIQESKIINLESFICEGLSDDEFENLLEIVECSETDYTVCDLNNGFFNIEDKGLISTLRADSTVFAVTKLAGNEVAKRKLTEKQAKAMIASNFNYIIQLENDLYISSIAEFSLNKAGSLVMTEIVKRINDTYTYNI